ncbi:MAG: class I SAM-dependent methyltransferase [Thermoguttaceae bacterium]
MLTTVPEPACQGCGLGLTGANFRKVGPSGLGDPMNAYPHSMAWFQEHLYVGTTRANLANRALQIRQNTPERMGEIWPVPVPDTYWGNDLAAEIWRYCPPTGEWTRLYKAPLVRGIGGFDVPLSVGFRAMAVFQGRSDPAPALYVPTWASHQTPSSLMLRSGDGVRFEVVSEPGDGLPENRPRSLRGLTAFNGWLFASPVVGQKRLEPNVAGYVAIVASADPAKGGWRRACEFHFGDPNNVSIFKMAVCNGALYAGTMNINEGFQVWKTDAAGEPPFRWKKVLSHGAYRGRLNQIAMTLMPLGDGLYLGSAIQNCSFDFDYHVGPAPPEVIRINPDDSWDLLVGEPRMTPDGLKVPRSGLGPGFGNPFAGYLWSMGVHEGWLYAATAVWAVFLRYSGRQDRWPPHTRPLLTPRFIEDLLHRFGGCDLWRTRDGDSWVPVTQNGFGNCYNIGFRDQVSSPFGLFVGAANPFGPHVAVRRLAGWKYEHNPRGGLEIWLGSAPPEPPAQDSSAAVVRGRLEGSQALTPAAPQSEREVRKSLVHRFFGQSGFRHFGYWRPGTRDAQTACEELVDEVAAFLPEKPGAIADVGCGGGATTARLVAHYPAAAVVGITPRRRALPECRRRAPAARFLHRRLPSLGLEAGSLDAVVWIKGFGPIGRRDRLLRQSLGALKPGGWLACFDVLPAGRHKPGWGFARAENPAVTAAEYGERLSAAGFETVRVVDVTDESRVAFGRQLAKFLALQDLGDGLWDLSYSEWESYLREGEPPAGRCVLAAARKPLGA